MHRRTEGIGEPVLNAKIAVPDNAFKEGIDQPDNDRGGQHLRPEFGALGNAARDDRRNRCCKGRQKEEFDQCKALQREGRIGAAEIGGAHEEGHAIGDPIADEEIGDGGKGEIHHDLDQGVDLILVADSAHLEKGKAAMHGKDQNGPEQNEKDVETDTGRVHRQIPPKHERLKYVLGGDVSESGPTLSTPSWR